jgi:archaemetzincin
MTIYLLPVMGVTEKIMADIAEDVGNAFLAKVRIADNLPTLPDRSYDKEREQYDTNKLIPHIEVIASELDAEKVIAIGNIDMFLEDLSFVFGIAQKGGYVGMISLYRLDQRFYSKDSDYDKLKERAAKEVIHELGHCYNLAHCSDNKCVMSYSNDIMAVDKKSKHFCEDCRVKMRKAF